MTRLNLIQDPSFRDGTAYWAALNSAVLSVEPGDAFYGAQSLRVTKSGVNGSGIQTLNYAAVQGNLPYAVSAYVKVPKDVPAWEDANLAVKVQWQNVSGTTLSESITNVADVTDDDGWFRLSGVFQAPNNAARAFVQIVQIAGGTNGQIFLVDAVQLEQSSYVGGYHDNLTQAEENTAVNKGLVPPPPPAVTGMELNADVILNDLVLNTIDEDNVVWICTDINGWWTLSEPQIPAIPRGFEDGDYDVSGRTGARVFTLTGSFFPPSSAQVPAARDRLIRAVNLIRKGGWIRTNENPTKAAFVRLSGRPQIQTVNARGRTDFSIGLKAADPIKYEWNDSDNDGLSYVTVNSSDGIGVVENIGTADVTAVFEVTGPMGGGSTIYNNLTDETMTLVSPLRGKGAVATVTGKLLVDSVATLYMSAPSGLMAGDLVTVAGVGAPYDSTGTPYTVIAASDSLPYTISYSVVTPDIPILYNKVLTPSYAYGPSFSIATGTGWNSGDQGVINNGTLTYDPLQGSGVGYRNYSGFTNNVLVSAGEIVYPSIHVALRQSTHTMAIYTIFYDAYDNVIQGPTWDSNSQVVPAIDNWNSLSTAYVRLVANPITAPPGSKRMDIIAANPNALTDPWYPSDGLSVDRASTAPGDYFDGATTDTNATIYSWTGQQYASVSSKAPSTSLAFANSGGAVLLAENDVLEIDTYNRNVTYNGSVLGHRSRVETLTDWIKLAPGENSILFNDDVDHLVIVNKAIAANQATLTTSEAHQLAPGDTVTVNLPETAALVSKVLTSNVVTLTTAEDHGFSVGDTINVYTSAGSFISQKAVVSNVVTITTTEDGGFSTGDQVFVALNSFAFMATKARTSNVVTLTTPEAHGFSVGDQIQIALPLTANIVNKNLTGNVATLGLNNPAQINGDHNYSVGDLIAVVLPVVANVTNKSVTGSTVVLDATAHGFSVGDSITIALPTSATPTGTRSISSSTLRATINTTAPHGFVVGDSVTVDVGTPSVQAVTNRSSAGTVRTLATATHNWTVGEKITVTGINANYNGTYYITAVSAGAFTYDTGAALTETVVASGGSVTNNTIAAGYNGTKIIEAVTSTSFSYNAYEQLVNTSSTALSAPTAVNTTNTAINGTKTVIGTTTNTITYTA